MYILACERCGRIYLDRDYCHPWICDDCRAQGITEPPADLEPASRPEPIETDADPRKPEAADLGPLFG